MRGRGRAGSPLSQFEQQADEITQVVVARLTNEHRDGDESNKTGRATFCLLTHRCIHSSLIIQPGKKNKSIFYITLSIPLSQLSHP